MDIADTHVPLKKFMIKAKPVPWLMEKIRDLKNHEQTRDTVKLEAKKIWFSFGLGSFSKTKKLCCKN